MTRRKKIILALLGTAVVLVGGALGVGLWWLQSDRFDAWAKVQVITLLRGYDIEAEIAALDVNPFRLTADVRGLRLKLVGDTEPFLSTEKLTAQARLVSLFRQDVEVESVTVERPVVRLAFDDKGQINLSRIKLPPPSEKKVETKKLWSGKLTLTDGSVVVADTQYNLSTDIRNLRVGLSPSGTAQKWTVAFSDSRFKLDGKAVAGLELETEVTLHQTKADVGALSFNSPYGKTAFSGQIAWGGERARVNPELGAGSPPPEMKAGPEAFTYEGTIFAEVDLARASDDFLPTAPVKGMARLRAKIDGDDKTYRAVGALEQMDLTAMGAKLTALGATYNLSSPIAPPFPAAKSDVSIGGITYGRIVVSDFKAHVEASPEQVALEPFEAKTLGGGFLGKALIALSKPEGKSAPSSSAKIDFNGIDLKSALAVGAARPIPMVGKLNGAIDVSWPGLDFKQAAGTAEADFTGSVTNQGSENQGSGFRVQGSGENQTAPSTDNEIPNKAGRETQLSLPPGTQNPEPRTLNPILVRGELAARLHPDRADVEKFDAKLGESTLSARGVYNFSRQTRFDVKFHSPELAEAQELAARFGVRAPSLPNEADHPMVKVGGAGDFEGVVSGPLTGPNVSGRASVAEIRVKDSVVGRFSVEFDSTPETLKVKQAELVQPEGGRLVVGLNGAMRGDGKSEADVTLDEIRLKPIGELVALLRPPDPPDPTEPEKKPFDPGAELAKAGGTLSGRIRLSDLPALNDFSTAKLFQAKYGQAPRIFFRCAGETVLTGSQTPYGPIREARAKFAVDSGEIRLESFTLSHPDAALAAEGKVVLGGPYELKAWARNVNLAAFGETLKARGYPLTGQANIEAVLDSGPIDATPPNQKTAGENPPLNPPLTVKATSKEIGLGDYRLTDVVATVTPDADQRNPAKVRVTSRFLDHPYEASGIFSLNFDSDEGDIKPTIDVGLAINRTPIVPVLESFGLAPKNVRGDVTGTVRLAGPLYVEIENQTEFSARDLRVVGEFSDVGVNVKADENSDTEYPIANDGPLKVSATPNELSFDQFRLKGENTRLDISGRVGTTGKTNLSLDGDVDLKILRTFISNSVYTSGKAHLNARVSGTFDAPRLSGTTDLDGVNVRIVGVPIALENGGGRILFTANQAQIDTFTADSGTGKVELSGGVVLDNFKSPRFRLGLRADNIRMNYPKDVRSLVDGELTFQGNRNVQVLSGNLKVKHAEYTQRTDLVTLLQAGIASAGKDTSDIQASTSGESELTLDVNVEAPDSLFIRNNLADLVGTASLRIRGTVAEPRIVGRIIVTRGQLEFRDESYQITRGVVVFPQARSEKPFFDIQGETEIQSYNVILGFTGNIDKVTPVLRSEPPLPQTSILTLLATGSLPPPGQNQNDVLSSTQTGVSAASSLLAELLNERLEERTSRLLGINRFQIDPLLVGRGNDPTARLTIGQRITKDLSVTYSRNLSTAQEQIILIEYRVAKNVSIVGLRDQRGNFGFDVRVTKRF